jgi:hypothetical protein
MLNEWFTNPPDRWWSSVVMSAKQHETSVGPGTRYSSHPIHIGIVQDSPAVVQATASAREPGTTAGMSPAG